MAPVDEPVSGNDGVAGTGVTVGVGEGTGVTVGVGVGDGVGVTDGVGVGLGDGVGHGVGVTVGVGLGVGVGVWHASATPARLKDAIIANGIIYFARLRVVISVNDLLPAMRERFL
jgi:hypothetical protein